MDNLIYSFRGEIWTWSGKKTDWFFVTVPSEMSAHIRYFTSHVQRGFKSLKVRAQIGDTFWETSMFPSKQRTAYLLPVKKACATPASIRATAQTSPSSRLWPLYAIG